MTKQANLNDLLTEVKSLNDRLSTIDRLLVVIDQNKKHIALNRPSDEFLTVEEFASLLRVSRTTVFKWLKLGLVKKVKAGRRSFIHKSDSDKVLKLANSEDSL